MDVAAEARRAVHSLMGGDQAVRAGLPEVIAGTISRVGGDVSQVGPLTELLQRFKVKTADDARAAIAKMEAAMGKTPYSSIGELAQAVGKGGLQGIIEGASLDDVMAMLAQSRGVTSTREEAAELTRQLGQIFAKPEVRAIVEKQGGRGFFEMGFAERFGAMQGALENLTPEQRDEKLREVPAEQRQRLLNYFGSESAVEMGRQAREAAAQATASTTKQRHAEWMRSGIAVANILEAQTTAEEANLPIYEQVSSEMRERAKARVKQIRQRMSWFQEKTIAEEDLLQSALFEQQIQSLGATPVVLPGQDSWQGTAHYRLKQQLLGLLSERGIESPQEGVSVTRQGVVAPTGAWVPAGPQAAAGGAQPQTVLFANHVHLPHSNITRVQQSHIGGGVN